jgi:hypothetical protein
MPSGRNGAGQRRSVDDDSRALRQRLGAVEARRGDAGGRNRLGRHGMSVQRLGAPLLRSQDEELVGEDQQRREDGEADQVAVVTVHDGLGRRFWLAGRGLAAVR